MPSHPRYTLVVVMIFVIASRQYYCVVATSSSSSSNKPLSSSSSLSPKSNSNSLQDSSSSSSLSNEKNSPLSNKKSPQQQQQTSQVTFLYELYEHEIYNPNTDSWGSRRFTQSRESGGGGRDYQSLDPQTCTPPRGTMFQGEWKIDVKGTGETRDGFGWEYYVGRYDGLGRRRRRWLRNLKRIGRSRTSTLMTTTRISDRKGGRSSPSKAAASKSKSSTGIGISSSSSSSSSLQTAKSKPKDEGIVKGFREQYNFKGFGWSFYKSMLTKRAFGASLRVPLSANLDFYDKKLAWPLITSSTYFGYPWVVATFLNASLPMEAIKWVIGGIIWKIMWAAAVVSACIRGIAEGILSVLILPWTICKALMQLANYVKASLYKIFVYESQDQKIAKSLMESVGEEESSEDATKRNETKVEGYIELSGSAINGTDEGDVAAVPRGGATRPSSKRKRKKHLTMFGYEIPPFHRTTSIEYSTTISERVGVCISWRVSQERGYEYRCNFYYSCLPTLEFWEQAGEARRRRISDARQKIGLGRKKKGSKVVTKAGSEDDDKSKSVSTTTTSGATSQSKIYSFLVDHSASFGCSAGWPLPVHPHFSFSVLLSLSGFYYSWLLKRIGSMLLPSPKNAEEQKECSSKVLPKEGAAPTAEKSCNERSSTVKSSSGDVESDEDVETDGTLDESESEAEDLVASDSKADSDGTSNSVQTGKLVKRKAS